MSVNNEDSSPSKLVLKKARVICNVFDTEYEVVKQVASETFSWRLSELEDDEWDITWTDNAVPSDKLTRMRPYQHINHFPGMHGICKKNYLAWNLNKMQKIHPKDYSFYPRTWVLPGDYSDFKQQVNKKKVFIVKPEASSQGRGIFLIRKLEDLNLSERYVVQEYLMDPLLIEGLKFDLRIYVLITGCNPLRIFIHEEGLTRLATEPYTEPSMHNFGDSCMHLTNYAINKTNPRFQFNINPEVDNVGHKRSLKSAYDYIEAQGHNVEELREKIDDIILKTICAVQPSLAHVYKSCQPEDCSNSMCFELLGFDVIIDSGMNPFLLEVNHSPSFTTDTPLDHRIKSTLIKDTLQMLGIRTRDRKNYYREKKNETQKRAFSHKGNKETREERLEKAKIAGEKKEKWENAHLAGFRRLFPTENNKEKYEMYLNSANQVWSDISSHISKKKIDELNKSNPGIKIASKAKPINPRRKANLSNTALHKPNISSPMALLHEEAPDSDFEVARKFIENNKISFNFLSGRDLVYYNQLNEILKDKRHSISFLRGTEFHATIMKLMKSSVQSKDYGQGNFVVPKIFEFSTKSKNNAQRIGSEIKKRHTKILNNTCS